MATRIGASCIAVSAPAASMQVVDFNSPPVSLVLESLLEDKTTKGNILLTIPPAKPKRNSGTISNCLTRLNWQRTGISSKA